MHECDEIDSVQYLLSVQKKQRPLGVGRDQTEIVSLCRKPNFVPYRRLVVWVHEQENGTVLFAKAAVFNWNYNGARVLALPSLKTVYFAQRSQVVVIRKVEILLLGVAAEGKHRVFSIDEEFHKKRKKADADGKPHRVLVLEKSKHGVV